MGYSFDGKPIGCATTRTRYFQSNKTPGLHRTRWCNLGSTSQRRAQQPACSSARRDLETAAEPDPETDRHCLYRDGEEAAAPREKVGSDRAPPEGKHRELAPRRNRNQVHTGRAISAHHTGQAGCSVLDHSLCNGCDRCEGSCVEVHGPEDHPEGARYATARAANPEAEGREKRLQSDPPGEPNMAPVVGAEDRVEKGTPQEGTRYIYNSAGDRKALYCKGFEPT